MGEEGSEEGGREGRLTCRLSGAAVAGLILILVLVRNSFKIGTTEDISCRIGGNNVVPHPTDKSDSTSPS